MRPYPITSCGCITTRRTINCRKAAKMDPQRVMVEEISPFSQRMTLTSYAARPASFALFSPASPSFAPATGHSLRFGSRRERPKTSAVGRGKKRCEPEVHPRPKNCAKRSLQAPAPLSLAFTQCHPFFPFPPPSSLSPPPPPGFFRSDSPVVLQGQLDTVPSFVRPGQARAAPRWARPHSLASSCTCAFSPASPIPRCFLLLSCLRRAWRGYLLSLLG